MFVIDMQRLMETMSPIVRSVLIGSVVCGYGNGDGELSAPRKIIAHNE